MGARLWSLPASPGRHFLYTISLYSSQAFSSVHFGKVITLILKAFLGVAEDSAIHLLWGKLRHWKVVVTFAPRMWASVDSSVSTLNLAVIPAGQTFYQMGFASLELPFSAGRHSAGLLPAYWLFCTPWMPGFSTIIRQDSSCWAQGCC